MGNTSHFYIQVALRKTFLEQFKLFFEQSRSFKFYESGGNSFETDFNQPRQVAKKYFLHLIKQY